MENKYTIDKERTIKIWENIMKKDDELKRITKLNRRKEKINKILKNA